MQRFYRINQYIQAAQIRLLDEQGKQLGIVTREEAFQRARDLNLDVVEIASSAKPPVAKLIDFKKFKYLQAKKEQEEKKKAKEVRLKEIRLRPFTDDHDLEVRLDRASNFLKSGDKVKFAIKFSGREMAHPKFGFELANKIISRLAEISQVERLTHFEGRQLVFSLQPVKVKRDEKIKKQ